MKKGIIILCTMLIALSAGSLKSEEKKTESTEKNKLRKTMMENPLNNEIVDFNYKNTDIVDILKVFALKFNQNIIYSPSVTGKVNLRLKSVPFNEAFKILLDRMDLYSVQKSPNVIEILKENELAMQRKTYYPKNRFAAEMKKTLESLLTKKEKDNTIIAADEALNALIITSAPEVSSKIELLIDQLDKKLPKVPQINIKARLIEVQTVKDSSYGISWASKINVRGADVENMRVVKDMGNYDLDDTKTGFDTAEAITNFASGGVMDISAVIDEATLYGVLNFLASTSKANTISEPTILTENNKSAKIHVGQNLPVRTIQVTETGTTQNVEYIPEGVDLSVTPVVPPGSSLVYLNVKVNVSEFIGFQADSPITTERSAETDITIETGKTVIIGGLIKEKNNVANTGIPILKDIPLIGFLFKNQTNTKVKTELLIFLTPEIIYN
jgi:type II secretory pathway component GspD/PulD (secretin)